MGPLPASCFHVLGKSYAFYLLGESSVRTLLSIKFLRQLGTWDRALINKTLTCILRNFEVKVKSNIVFLVQFITIEVEIKKDPIISYPIKSFQNNLYSLNTVYARGMVHYSKVKTLTKNIYQVRISNNSEETSLARCSNFFCKNFFTFYSHRSI